MSPLRNAFTYIVLLYAMCGIVQSAHATGYIYGPPLPGTPCSASYLLTNSGACVPSSGAWASTGKAYWPANQNLNSGGNSYKLSTGFVTSYVPVSGTYKMRAHWCSSSEATDHTSPPCTVSASVQTVDSIKTVELSSALSLTEQSPNFGGGSGGKLSQGGNMCLTFVDSTGREYKTHAQRTCQDAQDLPDTPTLCSINANNALSVDMGTLERKNIVLWPNRSPTKVSKTIAVICTGDSSITMDIKFDFSEMILSGGGKSTAIRTSTPGLGIVVSYNDHVIQGSSDNTVTGAFKPGVTNVKLEFEAVRDPLTDLKDIATGAFSASAIMIMTEH